MVPSVTKMTEATYFILAALLEAPLHGYGIIKRAGEQSAGRVRLAVGTLYGTAVREEAVRLQQAARIVTGQIAVMGA